MTQAQSSSWPAAREKNSESKENISLETSPKKRLSKTLERVARALGKRLEVQIA